MVGKSGRVISKNALAAPDIILGLDEPLELMATAGGGTLGRTCEEIQLKKNAW
jgi:hypothetical protein